MRMLLLIVSLFPLALLAQDLAAERQLYSTAFKDENTARELLHLTGAGVESDSTVQTAYRGAALMVWASHAKAAGRKLKLFKEGRALMEKAIAAAPKSVEARFLRMTVQEHAPNILNYRDELGNDKAFILERFPTLKDAGLKKMIRNHAETSAIYTGEERKRLLDGR